MVMGMAVRGLPSCSQVVSVSSLATSQAGAQSSCVAIASRRKPTSASGGIKSLHSFIPALAHRIGAFEKRHCKPVCGRYLQVPRASSTPSELSGGGCTGNGGGSGGGYGRGSGGSGGSGDSFKDDSSPDSKFLSALAASYLALLETNPIPTKSVTCLLLNLFADLFCQIAIERTEQVDWKRAGVLGAIGCFMVAPCLHFWYLGLSKVIKSSGTRGALTQLFLDQFIFSPISIATFFIVLLAMEGRPHEITTKLRQDWFPTTVANWKLWVPFQFINFRLVPQSLQVAMANIIGVLWTVYLSYASHKPVEK